MSLQVYLYSFDVFQAAGIAKENLRYAALGTGLCEVSTSIACVSHTLPPQSRAQIFHLSSKHDVTWFKWIFCWFCVFFYGVILSRCWLLSVQGRECFSLGVTCAWRPRLPCLQSHFTFRSGYFFQVSSFIAIICVVWLITEWEYKL